MQNRTESFLTASVLAAAFSLLTVACGSEAASGPAVAVRDSAGITIVENSGSVPAGGGWSIAAEPELVIGTFEGDPDYQLFQVRGGIRLPDGRIAIGNTGSGEIRVYDASGSFLRSLGQKGEGPGEFDSPVVTGLLGGDTIVVVDQDLRRISLMHAEEGFIDSGHIDEELGGGLFPRGLFADRTVVMGGGFFFSSASGEQLSDGYSRRQTSFKACGLDGALTTDFGAFPGYEFYMRVRSVGEGMQMSARLIPFGKFAMEAVASDRFYYSSGDTHQVEAYTPSGQLELIIRLDRELVPVTAADLERLIEEATADAEDDNQARQIREGFDEMPVADFMPAFAELEADALGYLWIEEYSALGNAPSTYTILDPNGAVVGSLTLPTELTVLEIGEDYVLGLYRDELEVEYVHLYRLTRPD